MSETETPAVPAPVSDEPTVAELAGKVDKLIELVTGNGKAQPAAEQEPADVATEVQRELARLKQAEDRKAARDKEKADSDARLAAVEEKVKEKPPREYRRVENWHKWRLPEDK